MDRDSQEDSIGARVGGELGSHRPAHDTLMFVSTVSGGEFSAPFRSTLCSKFSRLLPTQQPNRELLQRHLQDQLMENFRDDNKPLDTLGDCVMAHARTDSLDYLVALYPLYTYPDTGDKIDTISKYDVRLYGSLYDVKNNMSLMDFHMDLYNVLEYAGVKKFGEAVRVFGDFSHYYLSAFLKL
jgi:hypothetical protein